MIYTEIESHPASLRERWSVLRLLWLSAGDFDVPPKVRRKVRRMAIRSYVFALRPVVASYLVNRNGDV